MTPIEGYFLITPEDLAWRPSNLTKIPNADFLERTKSELLGARLWRLPPRSANTLHKHAKAEEFYFVIEGVGTPAPVAPTERLVVGGLYRYVRNPMYLAVGAMIAGQALLLGRSILFAELAVFAAAVVTFVRVYEEPHLEGSYGDEYVAYRREVPGWWPRRPSART